MGDLRIQKEGLQALIGRRDWRCFQDTCSSRNLGRCCPSNEEEEVIHECFALGVGGDGGDGDSDDEEEEKDKKEEVI